MRGKYSELISTGFIVVAIILLGIGLITQTLNYSILIFLVLFFLGEMVLRGILSIAINAPNGLIYSIPLIILTSFLVSTLVMKFSLQEYFVWYVILSVGSGTFGLNQQIKEAKYMYMSSEVSNKMNREEVDKKFNKRKMRHLIIVSIYVVFLVVSYFLFN
jgi:hypothetical protein